MSSAASDAPPPVATIMEEFKDVVGNEPSCRYKPKRPIGKGSFATVWLMVEVSTGRTVVGKFMNIDRMSEKNRKFAMSEADNASKVKHPNIVEFLEKIEIGSKLLLVFEYADAGDLYAQVVARSPSRYFKEGEILLILAQLCLAMNCLHGARMMHRDLKTPNVFLTTSGLIKLGDFGFARQYDESLSADVGSTFCGTPYYLAPELWAQTSYSQKADVWSLGVVLYELMSLRKPFTGSGMRELIERVISGRVNPFPTQYSDQLVGLCQSMLSVDPKKRPSVREVLSLPIMSGGLKVLRKNVPRLSGVPQATRDTMVAEIDAVMTTVVETPHEGALPPSAPPPTAASP